MKDDDLYAQIYDYGMEYPKGAAKSLGEVSYKELRSGALISRAGRFQRPPLQLLQGSGNCEILKEWIERGDFLLGEPQQLLPMETLNKFSWRGGIREKKL